MVDLLLGVPDKITAFILLPAFAFVLAPSKLRVYVFLVPGRMCKGLSDGHSGLSTA